MKVKQGSEVIAEKEGGGIVFVMVCRVSHRVGGKKNSPRQSGRGGLPKIVRKKIRNHHTHHLRNLCTLPKHSADLRSGQRTVAHCRIAFEA